MNEHPKKISFVMPNLGGGGAERVISILLNNLDRNLFAPQLIIVKSSGSNVYIKDLEKDVEVVRLNVKTSLKYSAISFAYKLIRQLKRDKPDILFMGAGSLNAFFAPFLPLVPKTIKKIARESNLPSVFEQYQLVKYFYKKFYNKYDIIIAQSDDMQKDLISNFNIFPEKISKINNPIDFKKIEEKLSSNENPFDNTKINLLAAGRMTYQKGFDDLLRNFENAVVTHSNLHLTILGEGDDREQLLNLCTTLGLDAHVSFPGNVENPYLYMKRADAFILSSRFEGFPNVLLESLVCGCPVLANNCPGGINEILMEGFNGFIYSQNQNNFTEKLSLLLKTNFDKQKIQEDTQEKYGVQSILPKYEKLLLE